MIMHGKFSLPGASFRVADGAVEDSQISGIADTMASNAGPVLTAPPSPSQASAELPTLPQPIPPKVTQVNEHTWLLSNPGYTEAVTLAVDQIYVFEAS